MLLEPLLVGCAATGLAAGLVRFAPGPGPWIAPAAVAVVFVVWVHLRLLAPLARLTGWVDRRVVGDRSASVPNAGASVVRGLAWGLDRLLAARLEAERRFADSTEVALATLEAELARLGRGEVRARPLAVDGPLAPLATSLARATASLGERTRSVVEVARTVADDLVLGLRGLRKIESALHEQRRLVERAAEDGRRCEGTLEESKQTLEQGLAELEAAARELGRARVVLRSDLDLVGRRLGDVRSTLVDVDRVFGAARDIEEAVDLLAHLAGPEATAPPDGIISARAALASRRGRAAIEAIRQKLTSTRRDLEGVERSLAGVVAPPVPAAVGLDRTVLAPVRAGALGVAGVGQVLADVLQTTARALPELSQGADEVARALDRASVAGPKLVQGLIELDVDGLFEGRILEDLERARREQESGAGERDLERVLGVAEAAQQRIAQLVRQSAAVLEGARGG